MAEPVSNTKLKKLRESMRTHKDNFINGLPKIELHIHIEGTMTPELRWYLAGRHKMDVLNPKTDRPCVELSELQGLYNLLDEREKGGVEGGMTRFFELYYDGFAVLKDEEDFYLLAMGYFERAAAMNIRYCEPFFDPQGHTKRGVPFATMMNGFCRARDEAVKKFNVHSNWILCMLRDMSPESAMEHYRAALPYRDMIVGIGPDSMERNRPPLLFDAVFRAARQDGFKITSHCDVGERDTFRHIAQVVDDIGGTGADRVDHGLHAAEDELLLQNIKEKDLGMTICPWGYLCYSGETEVLEWLMILHGAGIKFAIGSDDPAYMEDVWLSNSLFLLRDLCAFTDRDFITLQKNALIICWASSPVKAEIAREIEAYEARVSSKGRIF